MGNVNVTEQYQKAKSAKGSYSQISGRIGIYAMQNKKQNIHSNRMEWLWIYDQQCIQQLMQNKDLLLYFESFLSIINKRNPTNIVGYERKVESMSNINISYKELKQLEKGSYQLLI